MRCVISCTKEAKALVGETRTWISISCLLGKKEDNGIYCDISFGLDSSKMYGILLKNAKESTLLDKARLPFLTFL